MTNLNIPSDVFQHIKLILIENDLFDAYQENGTLDMTGIILEEAKTSTTMDVILNLWQSDPHQFSNRPCATCQTISSLTGKPFGCNLKALIK